MKVKILFAAAAILTVALLVSRAQESKNAEPERYIKESERLWAETSANGDTALVERILADDFVGVAPEGTFYDKAREIADTRESPKEFVCAAGKWRLTTDRHKISAMKFHRSELATGSHRRFGC